MKDEIASYIEIRKIFNHYSWFFYYDHLIVFRDYSFSSSESLCEGSIGFIKGLLKHNTNDFAAIIKEKTALLRNTFTVVNPMNNRILASSTMSLTEKRMRKKIKIVKENFPNAMVIK